MPFSQDLAGRLAGRERPGRDGMRRVFVDINGSRTGKAVASGGAGGGVG